MLSDDKISHLSHILLIGLKERNVIEPVSQESHIRKVIKEAVSYQIQIGSDIDILVRNKLKSFSKKIYEGTTEWDVLYSKFFKEEEAKRGRI